MEMDPISRTPHLTPLNIDEANASGSERKNVLRSLSPSTPYTPHSSRRMSRRSFMSEDFRLEPEEAENMMFQNVKPSQISMVRVLSKLAGKSEKNRSKSERTERESNQSLEPFKAPNESTEAKENGECTTEIDVNGEAYVLHKDNVFRPLNQCMSVKSQFKGYAVRANGIFKPLGGSPAAIEVGTLYRVTPTNKYSRTEGHGQTSRALHRIKSVSQLLERGTSGQEEFMYVYDPHWEGFARTDETRRFPPENAMLKPGDLRSSVYTQDSEELFTSADNALRKANWAEDITNRQGRSSSNLLSRSLTLPASKKFLSPRAPPEPTPPVPQTPAMFTKPVMEQNLRLDSQGSWLNIDLPPFQKISPIPESISASDKSDSENTHAISPVLGVPPHFPPPDNVFKPRDVNFDSSSLDGAAISSSQVSPMATAFHKPISRASGLETPQEAALYTPALQQLINECVLVLCLCGSQSTSRPRLARIVISNDDSPAFDDMDLFLRMRTEYKKLQGFWRRWLSLKGLEHIDLIEYHKNAKRQTLPHSFRAAKYDFSPEGLLEIYLKPSKVAGEHYWVEWVHQLSRDEESYTLEFIEGWKSGKILIAAFVPISLSISAAVLWCVLYPGHSFMTAFILGIFVMFLGWSVVGLLAVLSYNV